MGMPPPLINWLDPRGLWVKVRLRCHSPPGTWPCLPPPQASCCFNTYHTVLKWVLIYYFPLLSDLWSDLHSHRAGAWGSKKKKCSQMCEEVFISSLDWLTSPAHTLHALWTNYLLLFLHLFCFSLPLCPQWLWRCRKRTHKLISR